MDDEPPGRGSDLVGLAIYALLLVLLLATVSYVGKALDRLPASQVNGDRR